MDFALIQAAREFCNRTKACRVWADAVTAPGDTQRFAFVLPAQTELASVKRAVVGGDDVKVLGSLSLPSDYGRAGTQYPDDALIQISATEYMLYPMPPAGIEILIQMALQPTFSATGISDDVFSRHAETISKGALHRLHSSPGKPYSDPLAAAAAKSNFETGVHLAANEAFRQADPSERRVKKHG